MAATMAATKSRKRPQVIETKPLSPWYEAIVADTGVDPDAIAASFDATLAECEWQPWSVRGAWEAITGSSDWTAWTLSDARALSAALDEPTSLLGLALPAASTCTLCARPVRADVAHCDACEPLIVAVGT